VVFVALLPMPDEDRVVSGEIGVVATSELLVTVRRAPPGRTPCSPAPVRAERASVGELLHLLVDDVAVRFFDVVDAADAEIDDLEDHIEDWSSEPGRRRPSSLRHDLLHALRAVGATRTATAHRRADARSRPRGASRTGFERMLADTRSSEQGGARRRTGAARAPATPTQSPDSESQNEVVKKLAVIASLLLLPTFVVGFYGQNFVDAFGDFSWTVGASTLLIVASTILQLALFRWGRWV
jgi:Mg2+ and Co2+ transporter CorA